MRIQIFEDNKAVETEITIRCRRVDEKVTKIISQLRVYEHRITGVKDGNTFILEADNILYIDTADKRTFFYTLQEVYETPLKLYELEEKLESSGFFRASKSTIINFEQIKSLRPEFGGRMIVTMSNGEKLYVSRQYVSTIKQKLGV